MADYFISPPLIDWSKPVQTRDGRKVELFTATRDDAWPIVGDVLERDGRRTLYVWTIEGHWSTFERNHALDLVNVPEEPKEHEVWLNIYWDSVPGRSSVIAYASRNMADKCASNSRIACKLVPFFEGEGLG